MFYSGLAGFLTLLPTALQFITGPFVDRWPARKTLVTTQLLQTFILLTIPIAHYFHVLTVQLVLVIMPVASFIQQFAYPMQTKTLPVILKKEELIKGNSYFAFAYQGIDLVFNAVSGILVAIFGIFILYIADSVIFATAAILFAFLSIPHRKEKLGKRDWKNKTSAYFSELNEGFTTVFRSLIAIFLIGSVIANFCIGGAMAVLPAFADHHGGPMYYGFFLAAISIGSLVGALSASWMGTFRIGGFTIIAFCIGAVCWLFATLLPYTWMALICFAFAWIPIGGTNVIFAASLQNLIPHHSLGRITTVSASLSAVAMPIGSLTGGYVASVTSSTLTIACTGMGLLVVSTVWLLHPRLRSLPKVEMLSAEMIGLEMSLHANERLSEKN